MRFSFCMRPRHRILAGPIVARLNGGEVLLQGGAPHVDASPEPNCRKRSRAGDAAPNQIRDMRFRTTEMGGGLGEGEKRTFFATD